MRRFITPAVVLLLLPTLAAAQDLVTLKRKVLANGVTVIVWERPSAGRVGTRMFYRVDVAAERPGTVGLTHMLEHFLFKGSDLAGTTDWEAEKAVAERIEVLEREITDEKNRQRDCFRQRDVFADVERDCPTPRLATLQSELDTAIAAQDRLSDPTWYDWAVQGAGGTNSTASTGPDWMKFDIDLPASKLELFMWTERARVERPVFRQFEAEREVVVNQIRGGDNRPDGKFERALQSMTYEASPYGWAHWFSDLTRATREDHWEIFHKYFIPQNAVLVVVGDVKADDVFRMAEAYWASWQPARPSPRLRTVEPPPVGEKRLTVSAPSAGPRIAINAPMPAVGHPDGPVFQVLGEILGGEDGRLAQELVTRRKIATSTRASGDLSKYPSHFGIRVEARANEDLAGVEAGIDEVLRRVAGGEVPPGDIAAAAGRLTLGLARSLEEIGSAAVTIGGMEAIHHAGYLNDLPRLWKEVTPADLARVVATYFARQMRTVGVLRRESAPAVPDVAAAKGAPPAVRPAKAGDRGPRGEAAGPGLNDPGPAAPAAAARDVSVPGPDRLPAPLAIAEHPWNAPPWLAPRRPSRFERPAPTLRHTELTFPDLPFTPPPPDTYAHRLSNGLRAFIVPDPLLPMAQITVLVDAPAIDDPVGKEGLASLLAGILRRTGTASQTREQVEAALARMNATLTISADQNGTRVHVVSPPAAAADVLALVAGLITAPDLESAFAAERDRLAVAAGRSNDAPTAQARLLFDRALYGPDHPASRRATTASVKAITLEDVRRFHRARYHPGGMALAVSGSIDRPAIERALSAAFGKAQGAAGPAPGAAASAAPPKPAGRVVVTRDLDIRQAHVLIGHAGIQGIPEDHAALEVLNYILSGGGFVSRMMKLLRTDTGITSALYGSVEPGRQIVNPYLWRFSGAPETIARGVRLSLEQIEKMRTGGVTDEEFRAAKTAYIDGLVPASYETPHAVATRLAARTLFGLYDYQSPQYLNYYAGDAAQLAALARLTRDDVNRAARKYLDPANLVIAVAGPLQVIRENASAEERVLVGGR